VNLVLVGLRASGKSTVGRLLAEQLSRDFLDTDQMIVDEAGMSVRAIFAVEGETGFRRREREAVRRAMETDGAIVAVGGGALADAENRARLRANGRIVWLRASVEALWRRMQDDPATNANRPDLTAAGGIEEIRRLAKVREATYREAAALIVETDGRETSAVAGDVREWLMRAEAAAGGGS